MLCEIYCEKFHQNTITFHEGLNTILGDKNGSNNTKNNRKRNAGIERKNERLLL